MRIAGFVSFMIGIAIAISGGAKMPIEGEKWPDTVPLFIVGILVAVIGLVIWRLAVAKANQELAEKGSSDRKDALSLLAGLIEPTRKLTKEAPSLRAEEINHRANDLLEEYVLPFAEERQTLIQRFGMEAGADVLVTMAFGERMLNRIWSASADGHVQEARACCGEALAAFEEAQTKVAALS